MFKKLYNYRHLLIRVPFLKIKYELLKSSLSSKNFYIYIKNKQDRRKNIAVLCNQKQPEAVLMSQTNRLLRLISNNNNCLVDSLIRQEVLYKNGYFKPIKLSIYKKDDHFKTHAWIEKPGLVSYKTLERI